MDPRAKLFSLFVAASAFALFILFAETALASATALLSRFSNENKEQSTLKAATQSSWDILYHLGGNGPWIPKVNGTVEGGIEPPAGCRVDQVHMMSRHGERFPTVSAGIKMLELYQRIQHSNVTLEGDLAFANEWDFFSDDPATHFESLVSTGPYAGTLEAFTTGVKLRTRYRHLLDHALARNATNYWASDSARVISTAQHFGAAFFGLAPPDPTGTLKVIPETADRGTDTLTPGRTCLNYRRNTDGHGHDLGYRRLDAFRATYEPAVVARLAQQNPRFPFAEPDVFTMQLMCGFETLARGTSPWCDVFTHDEWESFAYARDVIHYYRAGPGNPYSATMGWLWLNATAGLLRQGPEEAGPLFFSFVHDGDMIPLLTALDLFPQTPHLPTDHRLDTRTWRTSDVVPMGGRLILERLSCAPEPHCWSNAPLYPNHVYCEDKAEEAFVRVLVNDGVVAIPGCAEGPGGSCGLEAFGERVRVRGEGIRGFGELCGVDVGVGEGGLSFLHQ